MISYDYSDKVAVVTGGADGIGAGVAERMARSGARVVIWDMDIASPETKIAEIPEASRILVQVDVSDADSVATGLAQSEKAFGKVDILVNSAGIAGPTKQARWPNTRSRCGARCSRSISTARSCAARP